MEAFTSFFGAFFGVVGVNFAGRLFHKSDRLEGERDTLLSLILDEIAAARGNSVKYWSGETSDAETTITCALIRASNNTLMEHCHDLFTDHSEFKTLTQAELFRYRRAMTDGDFGDPVVVASHDRIIRIMEAASVLERTLQKRRSRLKRSLFS